jgi:hypothetical protein
MATTSCCSAPWARTQATASCAIVLHARPGGAAVHRRQHLDLARGDAEPGRDPPSHQLDHPLRGGVWLVGGEQDRLLGVLIGLAANWLIFAWVLARLPREHVALRSAAKAAVLGAVGFEVAQAGHGDLSADDHQDAQRGGVRADPRPARVHLLRVAVRAVRDRVGGDLAGINVLLR